MYLSAVVWLGEEDGGSARDYMRREMGLCEHVTDREDIEPSVQLSKRYRTGGWDAQEFLRRGYEFGGGDV